MTITIDPQRVLDAIGVVFTAAIFVSFVIASFKRNTSGIAAFIGAGFAVATIVALCSNCAAPPLPSPMDPLPLARLGESYRDEDSHSNCRVVLAHYCRRMTDCGATDFERCLDGISEGCGEIVGINEFETKRCARAFDLMECTSEKVPTACRGIGVHSAPTPIGGQTAEYRRDP